jgi:hypothetical protein
MTPWHLTFASSLWDPSRLKLSSLFTRAVVVVGSSTWCLKHWSLKLTIPSWSSLLSTRHQASVSDFQITWSQWQNSKPFSLLTQPLNLLCTQRTGFSNLTARRALTSLWVSLLPNTEKPRLGVWWSKPKRCSGHMRSAAHTPTTRSQLYRAAALKTSSARMCRPNLPTLIHSTRTSWEITRRSISSPSRLSVTRVSWEVRAFQELRELAHQTDIINRFQALKMVDTLAVIVPPLSNDWCLKF